MIAYFIPCLNMLPTTRHDAHDSTAFAKIYKFIFVQSPNKLSREHLGLGRASFFSLPLSSLSLEKFFFFHSKAFMKTNFMQCFFCCCAAQLN
jgi:hypothetical protein